MAKKKAPQQPLVSSVSTTLKKTVTSSTQVCSPEEVIEKKKSMMDIVDKGLAQFSSNLVSGKVELTSSMDLERLVKLSLLLSGEADSIAGKPTSEIEETSENTKNIEISMSKIEEILNPDDPEVQAMFNKIYNGYNQTNDID